MKVQSKTLETELSIWDKELAELRNRNLKTIEWEKEENFFFNEEILRELSWRPVGKAT